MCYIVRPQEALLHFQRAVELVDTPPFLHSVDSSEISITDSLSVHMNPRINGAGDEVVHLFTLFKGYI